MDQRTITTTSIQQVATGLLEMGQQLQRVANAEAFRDATAAEQVRRMQTAEQARRMQTAKKVRRIPTAEMIRKMPKVQYAGTRRYGQLHPRVDRSRGGHPQSSDERESDTRGSRQVQDPKTAQRVIELPYGRPIQSLSAGIPRPIPPTVQIFQPPLFPFMVAPVPQARITARHASPALAPTMTVRHAPPAPAPTMNVSRTPAVPAPPARTTRTTAADNKDDGSGHGNIQRQTAPEPGGTYCETWWDCRTRWDCRTSGEEEGRLLIHLPIIPP